MRSLLHLFVVTSVALGVAIRKDSGTAAEASALLQRNADFDLPILLPLPRINDTATDYEVIFYQDPNFRGASWGMTPIPNQPSSPTNGQYCYFVEAGRVSSLKLVKQRNDRKFSCRFFRTTDACRHNIPALTLDYPAERASLGPELDNQINSALCWWTSPAAYDSAVKSVLATYEVPSAAAENNLNKRASHLVDVFSEPDFWGRLEFIYYTDMVNVRCENTNDLVDGSSLKLYDFNTNYWCTFYDKLSCDESANYFDIDSGHGNSVHDLRLTPDLNGLAWDNRIRSFKCQPGKLPGAHGSNLLSVEARSEGTAYPVGLD